MRSCPTLAVFTLGFGPGSAPNILCGPGQVAQPLCALFSVPRFKLGQRFACSLTHASIQQCSVCSRYVPGALLEAGSTAESGRAWPLVGRDPSPPGAPPRGTSHPASQASSRVRGGGLTMPLPPQPYLRGPQPPSPAWTHLLFHPGSAQSPTKGLEPPGHPLLLTSRARQQVFSELRTNPQPLPIHCHHRPWVPSTTHSPEPSSPLHPLPRCLGDSFQVQSDHFTLFHSIPGPPLPKK